MRCFARHATSVPGPAALIVVEGKRTEPAPTTTMTWMARRNQIWRHIDEAWEVRGARQIFGIFIVEGDAGGHVPRVWADGLDAARSEEALAASSPPLRRWDPAAVRRRVFRLASPGGFAFKQVPLATRPAGYRLEFLDG